jgi:hypothetical protein
MEHDIKKCKKQHNCAQISRELASLISIKKIKESYFTVKTLIKKSRPYASNNNKHRKNVCLFVTIK